MGLSSTSTTLSDLDLSTVSSLQAPNVGLLFHLHDLPAEKLSAWSQLYEEIKLSGVRVSWDPPTGGTGTSVPWNNGGTATNAMFPAWSPKLVVLQDADDATAPTNYSTLMQYARKKIWYGPKSHSIFIRPKVQQVLTAAGLTRPMKAPWLDVQSSTSEDLPHYAFKYAVDIDSMVDAIRRANTAATTDPKTIDITNLLPYGQMRFTYYVTCRKTVHAVSA